jgi:REP element-mobilizing transposase RayT
MARPASKQLPLDLKEWGGKRKGAGRKRSGSKRMPHRARASHRRDNPVHVTLRVVHGIRSLRSKVPYRLIKHAMAAANARQGFRLVHFSVMSNHLHLIAEAEDAHVLSCAIRALEIRIAHAINRLSRRRGRLFADRYNTHALKTPREVRNGLAYVLLNARHHAHERGAKLPAGWMDPCSSGDYFDGWAAVAVRPRDPMDEVIGPPVRPPTLWLLTAGWRRKGPLAIDAVPGAS